jgi:ribonuclease BN (tRNA processing enzyme)
VILVDDVPYVVDCGNGVAWQLARAGVPLRTLRYVFVTHNHSDHNADYGNLLNLSWSSGLQTRVDTYGPPPLARMTQLSFELNAYNIDLRIADEGLADIRTLVVPHEITGPGVVMEDERVKVTAALVPHPPVFPNFAYRFDTPDRSIVISGDTAPSDEIVKLAKGADVLVHEALYLPALDRLVARATNPELAKKHHLASHTPTNEIGKIATKAGVRTVVLSHLVPGDDPSITDEMWAADVRRHFSGDVIVGKDLIEI